MILKKENKKKLKNYIKLLNIIKLRLFKGVFYVLLRSIYGKLKKEKFWGKFKKNKKKWFFNKFVKKLKKCGKIKKKLHKYNIIE